MGLRRIGEYIITLYSNLTMFIWNFSPEMHALRSIITHKNKIRAVKVLEEIKGDIAFFSTISTDNTCSYFTYASENLALLQEMLSQQRIHRHR